MDGFLITLLIISYMASLYAHLLIMDLQKEIKKLKDRLEDCENKKRRSDDIGYTDYDKFVKEALKNTKKRQTTNKQSK